LEVWNHLFVAGRLHKPHETVRACDAVTRAQARNARSAGNAALLTLPESFTELEFHRAIVRLSYDGDVRFLFAAEDESKVERIARSNGEGLREAYEDVVRELLDASVVNVRSTGAWSQDVSPETLRGRVKTLPDTVMAMLRNVRRLDASADAAAVAESVCASVGDDPERVGGAVRACVRQIVRASTLRQAVAGLLSTSPLKTIAYVGAKFVKSAQSRTSG
jgi:translocator assembly and maintenance protein 41